MHSAALLNVGDSTNKPSGHCLYVFGWHICHTLIAASNIVLYAFHTRDSVEAHSDDSSSRLMIPHIDVSLHAFSLSKKSAWPTAVCPLNDSNIWAAHILLIQPAREGFGHAIYKIRQSVLHWHQLTTQLWFGPVIPDPQFYSNNIELLS